ncbi:Aste57867_17908 [Aphanomyces stellatus]|uniref:Aste57867_17908 protein n=1 Tax=Aphanomyces stellatus TaxID=120398 RepID=A0A485L9L4_9STRA|nr:hypothetical protein As57867_017847 [Aphanomyces stellatus]VFT94650.1 Aste57867_17908 [Aphanomyces stellatus]
MFGRVEVHPTCYGLYQHHCQENHSSIIFQIQGNGLSYAVVGSHYLTGSSDGELVKVIQEIKHHKNNPSTFSNDVAILILERDITSIAPVEVSFDAVPAGVLTWVRGWGTTSSGGTQSQVLKEVGVAAWDNAKAATALKPQTVDATMLAAGGLAGEDSCGPLTIEDSTGSEKIVGVVSWGYAVQGKPGVYGRLCTARDFIEPYLTKSPTTALVTKKPTPAPTTLKPTLTPRTTTRRPKIQVQEESDIR